MNRRSDESLAATVSPSIWHKRLGHLNQQSLRKLVTMADGLVLEKEVFPECIACVEGKHSRNSFLSSVSRAKGVLELKECSVGPIEVPSIGGSRFLITFIDDASRKVFLYFLERKIKPLKRT